MSSAAPFTPADLFALDGRLRRALAALTRARRDLQLDPVALQGGPFAEPLAAHRPVAGKTTYDALGALDAALHDRPLRDALRAWVGELTVDRVAFAAEVERAVAWAEPSGRLSVEPPRSVALREVMPGVLTAPAGAVEAWLEAAQGPGPAVAAAVHRLREVRAEARRRLGGAEDPFLPVAPETLRAGAEALLRATDDAAAHLLGGARKRLGSAGTPAPPLVAFRYVALAAGSDGWPARLDERWALGAAPGLAPPRELHLPPPPPPLGAASFLRALAAYGEALARAAVAPSVPAALALSPASLPALELGAALAIAGAGEAFARRALGLGRGRAQDHERAAAGVLLLAARLAATRVLLAEPVDRGAFEEHTARLFGAPLPAALHGAWPLPQRGDGARLLAVLGALPLARELRERCDEDWFRNPRAGHLVASLFAGPVWPPAARAGEDLAAAARGLGAEVEGRLG